MWMDDAAQMQSGKQEGAETAERDSLITPRVTNSSTVFLVSSATQARRLGTRSIRESVVTHTGQFFSLCATHVMKPGDIFGLAVWLLLCWSGPAEARMHMTQGMTDSG